MRLLYTSDPWYRHCCEHDGQGSQSIKVNAHQRIARSLFTVTVAMNLETELQEDRVSGLFYSLICHKCLEQNLPQSRCRVNLGWMNDLLEKSKG